MYIRYKTNIFYDTGRISNGTMSQKVNKRLHIIHESSILSRQGLEKISFTERISIELVHFSSFFRSSSFDLPPSGNRTKRVYYSPLTGAGILFDKTNLFLNESIDQ